MGLINLDRQYKKYKTEIQKAVNEVLDNTQFILGPQIQQLEEALCSFNGAKYCLATSSGTDSLMLALAALDIGQGDEVICTPYTWISPIEAVVRFGAKPVFVDIDSETYLMDPSQIEKAITKKTKAIIPVSLYGQMADLEAINEIARRHNLAVIEDGAQSFGAAQNGVYSGNNATISATSFFPTKALACYGDGGAVFTNDEQLFNKMKALRVHGATERYNHQYIGMNARMDTLQAAIVLAKLPFYKDELKRKEEIANYFDSELSPIFQTPEKLEGNTHIYSLYVLQSDERERVIDELNQKGIANGVYYPIGAHLQPAYSYLGYKQEDFPRVEHVSSRVFSIPMNPWLEDGEIENIVKVLKEAAYQLV